MMRIRALLCLVVLVCSTVVAQRKNNLELGLGIGAEIEASSQNFKSDRCLSASLCYNITDSWGFGILFLDNSYKFNRLTGQHQTYLGSIRPDIKKSVTGAVLEGRYSIPTNLTRVNPYFSVGVGYARSTSSSEGFYFVNTNEDTTFFRISSGQSPLGDVSFGVDVKIYDCLSLFAELKQLISFESDLNPTALSGRMGIGVTF